MPEVEQLNLGHLIAGLVGGTLVVILAATLPRVRPYLPALMAVAVVALGAPEVGVDLDAPFVGWLVLAAILVAGAAYQCARHASPLFVLGMLAASIAGMWLCLPDTEVVLTLLGVLLPVGVVARLSDDPRRPWPGGSGASRQLSGWAAAVFGATVVWVIGVSSGSRPEAAVGALASLGVLLVVPFLATFVTARLWSALRFDEQGPLVPAVLIAAVQCGVALVCSRVAGRADELAAAIVIAAAALGVAALASVVATVLVRRSAGRSSA